MPAQTLWSRITVITFIAAAIALYYFSQNSSPAFEEPLAPKPRPKSKSKPTTPLLASTPKQTHAFVPSERVRLPIPGVKYLPSLHKSRASCVGQDSPITNRFCRYENVCYSAKTKAVTFHLGAGADSIPLKDGYPEYAVPAPISAESLVWAPTFAATDIPEAREKTSKPVAVVYHWAQENPGHVLWEDLVPVWNGMRSMGLDAQAEHGWDIIAPNAKCSTNGCTILKEVAAGLGATLYLTWDEWYVDHGATDELCFDVAIGGPYRIYLNDIGSANRIAGREPLIYEAMSKIINYYSLPWQLPKKHRIVVTHKSYSQWARNPEGRHRAIANHVEVAGWLREAYPEVDVDIIEWQKLGVKGNLEELGKTTILLTPCGGVSMMLPFLPPGSHAIVMDYMKTVDDPFGGKIGESRHMDHNILEHFHHLRIDYYTIKDKSDYIWDHEGAKDARNDASVVIKRDRILSMVKAAFEDMAN